MSQLIERARAAFDQQGWAEAFAAFAEAAARDSLDAADHEHLAVCAYLTGQDEECAEAWEAAHRAALQAGDAAASARCAFWLALCLMLRGQMAMAGGWLARAGRLVEQAGSDCPGAGYLLIPAVLGALEAGDPATARGLAVQVTEAGHRFGDPDLRTFGILGEGQALIAAGEGMGGIARLDEAMVSVTAGETGPITSGIVYCAVILECMQLFDLRRASEWTAALTAWCEAQPDLVPYRGQCLVHRSQLQQAVGRWSEAITTVEAACRHLASPPHPAVGLAYYQEGELHRLVGAFEEAERDYRQAGRNGRHPMPGLALLRLARGEPGAAADAIRRALQETSNRLERPALLAAAVDILRATNDLPGARSAADELVGLAGATSSTALRAMAEQAAGTVLLGEGDPAASLVQLRSAAALWQSLHMPFEAARVAVLLGLTCLAMGDSTSAELEFDNAGEIFAELGARPDLERLSTLASGVVPPRTTRALVEEAPGLSRREREVLGLLAEGKTNRQVAAQLVISQHTVRRHVENIFAKLGVSSRAAATAYAYEHGLL